MKTTKIFVLLRAVPFLVLGSTGLTQPTGQKLVRIGVPLSGKIELKCLVSFGDFQEISVYRLSTGSYGLFTQIKGSAYAYALPPGQWPSQSLKVPCTANDGTSCAIIKQKAGRWVYDTVTSFGSCFGPK